MWALKLTTSFYSSGGYFIAHDFFFFETRLSFEPFFHCSNRNSEVVFSSLFLTMLLFPSYLLKFRYADLKNNRLTDYTFSFEKMLSDKVPSCTLISFDLIKNHSLSIWMMITHMIRYAGKYRCLPSVCACSYLFHHPESQQGY